MSAKHILTLCALLGASATATTSLAGDVFNVNDLAAVQADRIMYAAQAARAKAKAELDGFGSVSASATGTAVPVLRQVAGANGLVYGQFLYSTGAIANAKAGDTLPGNYRVKSVGIGGATITDAKGKVLDIPLSAEAPSEPDKVVSGTSNGSIPFPMVPPMAAPKR